MKPWEREYNKPPGKPWERQYKPVSMALNVKPQAETTNTLPPPLTPPARDGLQVEAESTSPLNAALIGAGRTSTRLIEGARDIGDVAPAFLGNQDAAGRMRQRGLDMAEADRLYRPMSEAHPVASAVGEAVPYMAAPMRLPGMSAAASNMTIPAALGFMEYGPIEERVQRGGAGLLAGMAGSALPRALAGRPFADDVDDYLKGIVQKGEKLGFKTMPSSRLGPVEGRGLMTREAAMESSPRTGEMVKRIHEGNARKLTRIAAKEIGLDNTDRLTPDSLERARAFIGSKFDDAGKGKAVSLDQAFKDSLNAIKAQYSEGAGRRSQRVANTVDDLLAKGDTLSMREYKRQTSALVKDAMSAAQKDAAKGDALLDIRAALDDAFDRSVPGDLPGLKKARDQWRTMLMVEQAVNEAGDVSYPKLANIVRRKDQWGYLRGNKQSDLYDALRYFKAFPREFGSSGTAERLAGGQSAFDAIKEDAFKGGVLGGMLDYGLGGATGGAGTIAGTVMGATSGATRGPRERAAAALYLNNAMNQGLLPLDVTSALRTQAGQGLLGRSATRVLTPLLMSLPESE